MTHAPSRRDVVAGLAFAATGAAATPARAAPPPIAPLAPAAGLITRTSAFLASLDAGQRKAASFALDGAEWRGWNYFGVGGYIKPGLRLEQMKAEQKDAAWSLFAELLSAEGLAKARNVMLLQDILAEAGNGRGLRSSERFSMSVFGTPAPTGAFGLRLEGHHLSLSFAVKDGALASITPAAFAALPNRVKTGRHAGLNTLKGEEQIARRLQADLAPKLKSRAQASSDHLFNILSSAGRERANAAKTGVAAADMTQAQRELLWQLVETYAVEPYAAPIAATQKARVRSGDQAAVHFAWYGPNTAEKSFGYRIIADAFVIELGCIDSEAQHLHPVYNDLGNVLGRVG